MFIYFIYGSIIGSFFGLLIDRFYNSSIFFPASHCKNCQQTLGTWDLIPIISQIVSMSRCRYCESKIPYWYAVIELFTGFIFVLLYLRAIDFTAFFIILLGLILSAFDIKYNSYPLIIWLMFTIPILLLNSINLLFIFLIVLTMLAFMFDIKIGSGDFLFLATLSLSLSELQILFLIQFSSFLGIIYFVIWKKKIIPFVPFMYSVYLLILAFTNLLP
ncbi:hypothetical protein BG261_04445 [Floricoccus tropicus]|uniref:Prepilin peptidase A24 N-terminal domain-containing protein n=1 Tax=Floricoccus tropicus TaxID=1859473 RepID=A0A1E8GNP3_9LACT|nr:A24 family peptidase [Floricoccus tropicus]OFI49128.1 hypothetical protein BG261_04445 [Floricoccus tropicus]